MVARRTILLVVAVSVAVLLCVGSAEAKRKKDPKECEVCKKLVGDVMATVPADKKKDRDSIEAALGKFCKNKKLNSKDKKACYYMVDIKRKVADPLARGLPADRVCKKLQKANAELCEMRYPTKVDKDTDYKKLRVKALKSILRERGVKCRGCIEKADFVRRCKETEHLEL